MSATFTHTLRAVESERSRASALWLLAGSALLGLWCVWFFRSEVTVHETSESARVEVSQASHPIDAPVAGRVARVHFALGAEVQAGDLLIEIDAENEQRRLAEEEARLASFQPQLDALARQLASIEQSRSNQHEATRTALEQARARQEETRVAAAEAADEAARATRLATQGAISDLERQRATALGEARNATAEAASLEAARLAAAQRARDMDETARAEELRRTVATLEGDESVTAAAVDVLRQEIARRTLRAQIGGRIAADAIVRPGEYVHEGQRLGSIVPPGHLRAVAEVPPPAALGRVHEGQLARLRLDGFPWTQFGVVPARVSAVGSEVRDGRVRVELELLPAPGSRIPLQHGLPGSVEIDVERATPAEIVFRASGRLLGRPVSEPGPAHAPSP